MTDNVKIIAAIEEYDAAMEEVRAARTRVRRAEDEIKRLCGARLGGYMDGNELVAAMGRKLAENLRREGA